MSDSPPRGLPRNVQVSLRNNFFVVLDAFHGTCDAVQ